MHDLAVKWQQVSAEQGLFCAVRKAIGKALRAVLDTNSAYWFTCDLAAAGCAGGDKAAASDAAVGPDIAAAGSQLRIAYDIEQTIAWLAQQKEPWMCVAQEIEAARRHRHWFWRVELEGRVAGYIKVGFSQVYVTDYRRLIPVKEREAFFYDIYVVPGCRKSGLARVLVQEAMEKLRQQGYTRIGLHIPPWNKASIGVAERAGFRKVAYVRCIRFCGMPIMLRRACRD